ncbi:PREDICTED: uncharacterized protein LOC107327912 [Acropora digitifera]|uniref:uncharacterized protein LOC107327912 n=1 Tax=Acropora digitifera TaxID=70779 RepID=UPI00077A149D|nr:PREDICTED: uncharacterized protein LOC107327912 [Acropora digitifera]
MADLHEAIGNLEIRDRVELIIVASTFRRNFECVMAWDNEEKKLLRPVTKEQNSWPLGTFTLFRTYRFVIGDSTPKSAWPHKHEDIIVVGKSPSPRHVQLQEPELYEMLVPSSTTVVTDIFPPDKIKQNRYIEECTNCPSVGILRCKVTDIKISKDYSNYRCEIFSEFNFPVTAQNRESLITDLADCAPENSLLVLLGLARPFAGTRKNNFNPRRCYIMVIGIIREVLKKPTKGTSKPEEKKK